MTDPKPVVPIGTKPEGTKTPDEGQNVSRSSVNQEGAPLSQFGDLRADSRLKLAVQPVLRNLDGSAMQAFRLPASNRVVHDNRENVSRRGAEERAERKDAGKEPEKESGQRSAVSGQRKEGKAEEAREKKYENYLAERKLPFITKEEGKKLSERPLSEFEELLIKRFEEGATLEQVIKEGKMQFGEKTVEEWRAFFQKFLDRTASKQIELADIEKFLFRGLVKKDDAKAVVISDLIQTNGKTEKFVRFGVIYQKLANLLSKLSPGDVLAKQSITEGLTAEKLLYLALNPPSSEAELFTGLKPAQGMFGLEATEARVAEELGITRDKGAPAGAEQGLAAKGKKRRTGGFFRWLTGDEEVPLDDKGRFMPWWQWGTLHKPGGFTLKRAFYTGVFIIFILTILFLVNQYLLGK